MTQMQPINTRIFAVLMVCIITFSATEAIAQTTEIGIILGDPTGLLVLFEKGEGTYAVSLAYGSGRLTVHADYIINTFPISSNRTPLFYGGVGLAANNEGLFGLRVPIGGKHLLDLQTAIGIEFAPTFYPYPEIEFLIGVVIFATYRF